VAPIHSITSSARAKSDDGMVRPSALAVLRLITNSIFVVWITGRSLGIPPLRIRATPKHLAEKILIAKAPLEGERMQVTVLFDDLKGSMEQLEGPRPRGSAHASRSRASRG
jgi:hypothetical protein